MILSLHAQAQLFGLTILIGGSMGLLYDALRLFRHALPHSRLWIQLEDAVFWILAVFAVFLVLLQTNAGEIRFFVIFGLFGGMGLYFLTLSPLVLAVSGTVLHAVRFLLHLFLQILFTPFYLLYLPFRRPLSALGNFCGKQQKKCLQYLRVYVKMKKNRFQRDWKLLRNHSKNKKQHHEGSNRHAPEQNTEKGKKTAEKV